MRGKRGDCACLPSRTGELKGSARSAATRSRSGANFFWGGSEVFSLKSVFHVAPPPSNCPSSLTLLHHSCGGPAQHGVNAQPLITLIQLHTIDPGPRRCPRAGWCAREASRATACRKTSTHSPASFLMTSVRQFPQRPQDGKFLLGSRTRFLPCRPIISRVPKEVWPFPPQTVQTADVT